jgi:hypothetical protein
MGERHTTSPAVSLPKFAPDMHRFVVQASVDCRSYSGVEHSEREAHMSAWEVIETDPQAASWMVEMF